METWILQQCRRALFQEVLVWGILAAVTLAVPLAFPRYVVGFLFGPQTLTADQAGELKDPGQLPTNRVRIRAGNLVPTGLDEIFVTEERGRKVKQETKATLFVMQAGDKFLLVRMPVSGKNRAATAIPKDLEGTLTPIPDKLRLATRGQKDLEELFKRSQPFYLDTVSSYRRYGFSYMVIAACVFALLVTLGLRSWKGYRDPSRHPAAKRIAEWGEPDKVSHEVEREARTAVRQRLRGLLITDTYAIEQKFTHFDVRRLDDLLWVYENMQRFVFMGFIPLGRHCELVLAYDDKKRPLPNRHRRIQEALAYLAERVPWAVNGYSPELANAYRKDRRGIRAAVDKRRAEYENPTAPAFLSTDASAPS